MYFHLATSTLIFYHLSTYTAARSAIFLSQTAYPHCLFVCLPTDKTNKQSSPCWNWHSFTMSTKLELIASIQPRPIQARSCLVGKR